MILSEHFATLDCGSQVGMAVRLDEPNGYGLSVRLPTDGEQLPGLDVPERYRERLRVRMLDLIAEKLAAVRRR